MTMHTEKLAASFAAGRMDVRAIMEHLGRQVPVIGGTLKRCGEMSLADYAAMLPRKKSKLFQDSSDLAEVVAAYLIPFLGETVANRAATDLAEHRLALTSNHHGVDYFAQSVQGSLISALPSLLGMSDRRTVVVLACGNIPLNNLTYPQGLLSYRPGRNAKEDGFQVPLRLPLFPNSRRRVAVCAADAFDAAMVKRAGKKIEGLEEQGGLDPLVARKAMAILKEDYLNQDILELPSYALQASALNSRLWKRMFDTSAYGVDLAWIELEAVVAKLAIGDMNRPESLVYQVLFDRELRTRVLDALDGEKICWSQAGLAGGVAEEKGPAGGHGTMFFWGIDARGLKVALVLETPRGEPMRLAGTDSLGVPFSCPFTDSALSEGLDQGSLVPSLFTCYLAVNFARGVSCVGGYYQAHYLPNIQGKLLAALAGTGRHSRLAETVLTASTGSYLSGMQAVLHRFEGLGLLPAGPLEIAAHHGLNGSDLERMGRLSLRQAHCASLLETVSDVAPPFRGETGWKRALALALEELFPPSGVILEFS